MMKNLNKKRWKKIAAGQAMTEYAIMASLGLVVGMPVFSLMIRALMQYLSGIKFILNFPFP